LFWEANLLKTLNTYYEDYDGLAAFVAANKDDLLQGRPAVLVQVFSGVCDGDYLVRVAREIGALVPGAQVIGTTTAGEIMPAPWAPWTLMSTGLVVCLYSFSIPKRMNG
jgi:hypothetical protein